jgi:SAM-dependent methyltransferase
VSTRLTCPLCGPAPARVWRRHGGFTIVRCGGCGLLVTWPRPSDDVLRAFYARADYYSAHGMPGAEAWGARARGLLAHVPERVTSVLDFGAGEGHAVAAWRAQGLRAEGVEPSPPAREAARRRHGIDLAADLAELPANGFDLATAIHSLEHVPDPPATLRELASRVRPGGFVLIEVPHARTVELWTRRGRETVLHLPAHLFHFEPETLARVVARAGLSTVEVVLTNPDALERAFAWRARRRAADAGNRARVTAAVDARADAPTPRRGWRGLWSARLLPALRRRFPGYKFQLLARRPA